MRKLEFTTLINAPAETIWAILWDDKTYREWTSVFSEGSRAVTDWQEGSKIHFLGGEGHGMFSVISKKEKPSYMEFTHLGSVVDGEEQPETEESLKWKGCKESYTLQEKGGSTTLSASIEILEDHLEYFNKTFPRALDKVKEISERSA